MKRYMLSTIVSLSCMMSTMHLQTSQQPPRQGLSPDQVYKDLSPVQQTPSTFTTRLTFSPNRPITVEATETKPLVAKNIRLAINPVQLNTEIENLISSYYFHGVRDGDAITKQIFNDLKQNYILHVSAKPDIEQIIRNQSSHYPGIRFSNAPRDTSENSTITALKTFINSQIKNYRHETKDPIKLKIFIKNNMLQAFNLSGNDRANLLQFATHYLDQVLPTPTTPAPKLATTPTISAKAQPNEAALKSFITIKMNDHYKRIQRGEDEVPEELSLPDYLNYTVENDVREAFDFSGPNQRLQSYALTQINQATQALEEEELEEETTWHETTPVVTSPVTNIPPVATALPAPRAERMAQTPRPEGSDVDELSRAETPPNHPQTTGFGSLAHQRLSPTTTSLEPSSAIPDFSLEPSPTMPEQTKLTPDTESLLNFIHTQTQALRPQTRNLQHLSYAVEDQIFNTFDFSGPEKQKLEDFALEELDLAINDLMFEENSTSNVPPAATASLEPSPTMSESRSNTQPYQVEYSQPIAIATTQALETSAYEPHSFRPEQPDEYEYESTLPTTPSLKTSTTARTLLSQIAQNIIQQQPRIKPEDLRENLFNAAYENVLDDYNDVIEEITENRKKQLQTENQDTFNHFRKAYAGTSDPRRLLVKHNKPNKPDNSEL